MKLEDAVEGMRVMPSDSCPPYMHFADGILLSVQKDADGHLIHPPLLVNGVFNITDGTAVVSMYLQEVEPAEAVTPGSADLAEAFQEGGL